MGLGGTDLNLLVALRALLEEGNVTRAGDRLGMSQPTMSAALGRLRRHYGDELLVRCGRDHELTPLARSLLPLVQRAVPLAERALLLQRRFVPSTSTRTFELALSDYTIAMLHPALRTALARSAPGVELVLRPIPPDMHLRDPGVLEFDGLVVPRGFAFSGECVELFRDRFVLVLDPAHPALVDGRLSLANFERLPHACGVIGDDSQNTVDRHLSEIGVRRRRSVSSKGWLPLPFLVRGTDLVAIVPERLARQVAPTAGVVVVEPPFGHVEIVQTLWWHPTRTADAGHSWFRELLRRVAEGLDEQHADGDKPANNRLVAERGLAPASA